MWLYAWALVREFRWTLVALTAAVLVGGTLFAVTPHEALDGERPPLMNAAFAAWMTMFAESTYNPPETWYLALVDGIYPLLGFVLIGEGIVRFGLLMLSRRRGEKEWMKVKASTYRDHVVLCGLGRLGVRVLEQLVAQGVDVVAIEKDAASRYVGQARATGVPILVCDMTEDQVLIDAGVPHARAIIIATNDDMANLEVALDARRMNPRIRVAMRLYDQRFASKLGASFGVDVPFSSTALAAPIVAAMVLDTRVLASFSIGGVPHVTAELPVPAGCALAGKTVADLEAAHALRVLARLPSGASAPESPPPGVAVVAAGDTLVVHVPAARVPALSQLARAC